MKDRRRPGLTPGTESRLFAERFQSLCAAMKNCEDAVELAAEAVRNLDAEIRWGGELPGQADEDEEVDGS